MQANGKTSSWCDEEAVETEKLKEKVWKVGDN